MTTKDKYAGTECRLLLNGKMVHATILGRTLPYLKVAPELEYYYAALEVSDAQVERVMNTNQTFEH